jgi:hypothetical protein
VEKIISEALGPNWLNSGDTKDIAFQLLRKCVDLAPPDAVALGSVINYFRSTDKFNTLPEAEQQAILNSSHDHHHAAAAKGLLSVCDALNVTVQTPQRVCFYIQPIDEHRRPVGSPRVDFGAQDAFGGRLKMFGDYYYSPAQSGGKRRRK